MQIKTQAVVLKTYKYSETSIIAKMYTKEMGLMSFMIHGVRKRKSKTSASLFQALQILNLEINYKERANLQSIKEINIAEGMHNIHSNIIKSSIALFIAEMIFKCVKEEEANEFLFQFIAISIEFLNEAENNKIANFHLVFLLGLSRFLGFFPNNNYNSDNIYFIPEMGEFDSYAKGNMFFSKDNSLLFHQLLESNYSQMNTLILTAKERRFLLNALIEYYKFHLPEMGEIQSLDVLETVFS